MQFPFENSQGKKVESNGAAVSNGHAVNGKSNISDSEPKKIK